MGSLHLLSIRAGSMREGAARREGAGLFRKMLWEALRAALLSFPLRQERGALSTTPKLPPSKVREQRVC